MFIMSMSIEMKKNKVLILDITELNCDNNPLNKYVMLSYHNSFSFATIIGKPGSKKGVCWFHF